MRAGKPVIVSDPVPPHSVIDTRRAASAPTCGCSGRDFNYAGDRQQWNWAGRERRYNGAGLPGAARREPAAQRRRRAGRARGDARAVLPITAQAVRNGLALVELPGPLPDRSPASRPWCWTWRTTRTRWPRWRRTSTRWASTRAPMRCSARCATRTWRRSSRAWRRWWMPGTSPTCRLPRAARAQELADTPRRRATRRRPGR